MAKNGKVNERRPVPLVEQPYKIPDNWQWIHLLDAFTGKTDSKKKVQQKDYLKTGILPVVDQGQDLIGGYTDDINMQYSGNLPVVVFGDHTRRVKFIDFPFAQGADGIKILESKSFFSSKALYYALQTIDIPNLGYRRHFPLFKRFMIPLPPLAEQERIIERIESLFSKLDEVREKLQAALDGLELYKAALMREAFTGKLTERWRETRKRDNRSWRTLPFGDVAEVKSNLVDPLEFPNYPHIAPDNIEKKTGVLLDYRTVAEDGVTSVKHLFHAGQILYSKIRPYLSKVVIASFDGLCSADMYPVEPKEGFDTAYLWHYMLSDEFLYQASTAGSRSLLPKINRKELSRVRVKVTDIDEQREIAGILNRFFAKERHIKEAAGQVMKQLDMMKKVILGRAFRGELGTNRPEEPPASVDPTEGGESV